MRALILKKEKFASLSLLIQHTCAVKLAALTRRTCQCTVHVLPLKIHQITPTPILLLDWLNGSSQFHAGDNRKDYIDNFNFILRILRLACVALKYCKACELWCHSQGGHVWNSNRSAVELYSTLFQRPLKLNALSQSSHKLLKYYLQFTIISNLICQRAHKTCMRTIH